MTALTGGVAPALAKPDKNDPGIPIIPTQEVVIPEAPPVQEAPAESAPAPKEAPAPPKVESPPAQAPVPEVAAPAPAPQAVPQPAPAPQVQAPPQVEAPAPRNAAPAPPKKEAPRSIEAPKVDAPQADVPEAEPPKVDVPKAEAPKAEAPAIAAPQADAPKANAPKANAPKADAPKADAPAVDAPKADAGPSLPAVDQPAKPGDPKQDPQVPRTLVPGQAPDSDATDDAKTDPSAAKAAERVALAQPETLQAPEQDVQLARRSKPIEVKPEPAAKQDVDALSNAINLSSKTKLGPFDSELEAGSKLSVDRDRLWDRRVRQWDRDWIEYDEFYRPIIFNPFRAPLRIAYALANVTRILVIQPLARVVVDVAELAAYSFTAVVLGAATAVTGLANVAADVVNVAVGTFFGGGFVPQVGVPLVAPPPLLRYDNVPVQVRYSNANYEPFRVRQIVDVGDDVQYGGRKVLLDGATPAWGQWVTSPTGERQFEVHRTQQYPGLGEPQEAPLPGDYQMQLASDESAGLDRTQMYLIAAAGLVAGLGFGALGLAFALGRRRPQL
jgi:hypothetical protein